MTKTYTIRYTAPAQTATSIAQHGTTWTFDGPYEVGQFANGDRWVIGPVVITSITNNLSDHTPRAGLDGSQVNPIAGTNGWDDRYPQPTPNYDSALDVSRHLPYTLNPGESLCSAISFDVGDSGYQFGMVGAKYSPQATVISGSKKVITSATGWGTVIPGDIIVWDYAFPTGAGELRLVASVSGNDLTIAGADLTPGADKFASAGSTYDNTQAILTVAREVNVLTCVSSRVRSTCLRPPYVGTSKPLLDTADIDWSAKLPSLPTMGTPPAIADLNEIFERVQWDHESPGEGYYFNEHGCPFNNFGGQTSFNIASYGRDHSAVVGVVMLALCCDYFSIDVKRKSALRLMQKGLDNYYSALNGSTWAANGGHNAGRYAPILFAGYMLDNATLSGVASHTPNLTTWRFAENEQTFYVTADDVGRAMDYLGTGTFGSFVSHATGTAQAGSATTITLAADADLPNGYVPSNRITITSGTGSGQTVEIVDYDNTTKVLTVASWPGGTPNNTSHYRIEGYITADIGIADWGVNHFSNPAEDSPGWLGGYRRCCAAYGWAGMAIASRILGLQTAWGHDAFFDYVDRFRTVERASIGKTHYDGAPVIDYFAFTTAMYDEYEGDY